MDEGLVVEANDATTFFSAPEQPRTRDFLARVLK
jgi:hypothetical protein